ncbi:C-type lectin domain family 4 member K-like isoform X2 [Salarias fasciatus]|uniref:C-type lectin domain family 4 member K-like isoform X2 n=1 Tax=Salarias fasciatus TaxID=181472 RepID=UPI001176B9E9|nr:C-type lectin domain family 4 member K-like isoform X2 [Salarias fasciatus]
MEMVVLENEPEVLMENISNKGNRDTSAAPGLKLYRCVAVSFGLLCIIQVALNISLRLSLDYEAGTKNLTEERDELKGKLNDYISGNEAKIKTLTGERDELKRRLDVLISGNEGKIKTLTGERDELKRRLDVLISGHGAEIKTLTGERGELRRRLDESQSQQNALIRERDELKRTLNDFDQLFQKGWEYFHSSFYYISSTEKTWQESRDDCVSRGANLMIIDSQEEQDFTRRFPKRMWIGLTDRAQEGTWRWVDGTLLQRSYWYSGEPNDEWGEEDCAEINYKDVENSWNDMPCDRQIHWICEKKMAP